MPKKWPSSWRLSGAPPVKHRPRLFPTKSGGTQKARKRRATCGLQRVTELRASEVEQRGEEHVHDEANTPPLPDKKRRDAKGAKEAGYNKRGACLVNRSKYPASEEAGYRAGYMRLLGDRHPVSGPRCGPK
jgi:hypothetical protein